MKMNNNRKAIMSVWLGIIVGWIVLLAWAFYNEFPTDTMILFLVMFLCTGIVPLINLWNHGSKKCNLN